ncbi:MAG: ATP-binding protein [Prevotellaceae bacterium]|jgi:predicted AAA+ superfamily ATPase|nr:ATP-binding protein [Prevotellaceae bacterium]
MIKRIVENDIANIFSRKKAAVILGARQVGKTTLLKQLFADRQNVLWLNCDDSEIQTILETVNTLKWKNIIGQNQTVILDEAQYVKNIGIKLKLITDQIPDIQLIVTGSSSLDLANEINEPLTGRKREILLFPLSFVEMEQYHGLLDEKRLLAHRLVYGMYPEVVTDFGKEKETLKELTNSYLYKDILKWERIRKPDKIVKLLQALAFQIGNLVSYSELGQICGLDSKTVEQYIVLLEQSYVVFRLGSFSRNLRNELKNSRKIYFWDNGIRNTLISNFNPVELRDDTGALWENYMISERIKKLNYNQLYANYWFWRTQQQQEIDFIEEQDGQITAFEFKWNPKANAKIPKTFLGNYENSRFEVIHKENYDEFLR